MGLAYYLADAVPRFEWLSFSVPSEETALLLKALYLKKESFRGTASCVIECSDISEEGDQYRCNSVTLHLGNKKYYSDEFTYYNAIEANYVKMSYEEQK